MTEYEIILAKADALFGGKRRCEHANTTLVQHEDAEYGWFACYQCDRCGQITRQDVTVDDLAVANNAPLLDVPMYEEAIAERAPDEAQMRALAFFGKAAE
jgi:hypothetical protein